MSLVRRNSLLHCLCGRFNRSDANQLLVDELLNAHAGELAPVAGVLDASERQVRCRPGRVIDKHHASADAARPKSGDGQRAVTAKERRRPQSGCMLTRTDETSMLFRVLKMLVNNAHNRRYFSATAVLCVPKT
jgi:hypothetical protein